MTAGTSVCCLMLEPQQSNYDSCPGEETTHVWQPPADRCVNVIELVLLPMGRIDGEIGCVVGLSSPTVWIFLV